MNEGKTVYRSMFDRKYLASFDLGGEDRTVTIESVKPDTLKNANGQQKKIILRLEGQERPMVCNRTNADTICGMYGKNTNEWIGKQITIYETTCDAFNKVWDCIRVRPMIPKAESKLRSA